jgi:hypothetical protein
MAIITTNPVQKDGQTYDKLAINLALSPLQRPTGFGVSIAVRLTPYRLGEDGPEQLPDEARAVVYGDATADAAGDPVLAQFLQALEAAGQAFITAKGL